MAHDITTMVKSGKNAVAVVLGRGWMSMSGHTRTYTQQLYVSVHAV